MVHLPSRKGMKGLVRPQELRDMCADFQLESFLPHNLAFWHRLVNCKMMAGGWLLGSCQNILPRKMDSFKICSCDTSLEGDLFRCYCAEEEERTGNQGLSNTTAICAWFLFYRIYFSFKTKSGSNSWKFSEYFSWLQERKKVVHCTAEMYYILNVSTPTSDSSRGRVVHCRCGACWK